MVLAGSSFTSLAEGLRENTGFSERPVQKRRPSPGGWQPFSLRQCSVRGKSSNRQGSSGESGHIPEKVRQRYGLYRGGGERNKKTGYPFETGCRGGIGRQRAVCENRTLLLRDPLRNPPYGEGGGSSLGKTDNQIECPCRQQFSPH